MEWRPREVSGVCQVVLGALVDGLWVLGLGPRDEGVVHANLVTIVSHRRTGHDEGNHIQTVSQLGAITVERTDTILIVVTDL